MIGEEQRFVTKPEEEIGDLRPAEAEAQLLALMQLQQHERAPQGERLHGAEEYPPLVTFDIDLDDVRPRARPLDEAIDAGDGNGRRRKLSCPVLSPPEL